MNIRSLVVAGAVLASGLAGGLGIVPAAHADDAPAPEAPVAGTYKVSARSLFLVPNAAGTARTAQVTYTQTSALDATVTRSVEYNGTTVVWPAGSTSLTLTFTSARTYAPKLTLSRGELTTGVNLPSVAVQLDKVDPQVRITTPKKAGKAASWKVLRGTSSDVGTGVGAVGVIALQQRGTTWWSYNFGTKKWVKGTRKLGNTAAWAMKKHTVFVAFSAGAWRAPAIKGLRAGKVAVSAVAADLEGNVGLAFAGPRKVR